MSTTPSTIELTKMHLLSKKAKGHIEKVTTYLDHMKQYNTVPERVAIMRDQHKDIMTSLQSKYPDTKPGKLLIDGVEVYFT